MTYLRRLFATFFPTPTQEPDWTAIADRSNWATTTTRGRWVA